jgi:hypothetical protein
MATIKDLSSHSWYFGVNTDLRISAIYTAIKGLPTTIDLSNPATFVDLPFPSLLSPPVDRFQETTIDGTKYFKYMGRLIYSELEKGIRKDFFQSNHQDVYLYGSPGSGKSHLLAALAVQLVQEGKRVLYIPDCQYLLDDFEGTLRAALHFAFHGDALSHTCIEVVHGVENLLDLADIISDKYIIVDQLNALDIGPDDPKRELKTRVETWLLYLASSRRYIYSAFPSQEASQDIRWGRNVTSILLYGGMDKVCHISTGRNIT